MFGLIRASLVLTVVLVAAALVACADVRPSEPLPATFVPISDITTLAGKWEGLLRGMAQRSLQSQRDWVKLTIKEDGTYKFVSYRTIGVFSGSGTLKLGNGKVISESERGSATYTLYKRGGQHVLKVEGTTKSGRRLSAELTRAK